MTAPVAEALEHPPPLRRTGLARARRARPPPLGPWILALGLLSAATAAAAEAAPRKPPSRGVATLQGEPLGCGALADPQRSTFVLLEVRRGRLSACNTARATRRFTPASTFKIPHALLALESGVVADAKAPFRWDGRARGVVAWDRDTSLADALPASTVWVFQAIAGRLGPAREAAGVRRLGYGNRTTGGPADLRHFWLSGPLAISAVEQVAFLERLRTSRLHAAPASQARLRDLLKLGSCGPDCVLYGKTGAVLPIDDEGFLRPGDESLLPKAAERTGWFVGWVDRPDAQGGPLVFAHNLDLALPQGMAARTRVVTAVLSAYGVTLDAE